MYPHLTAILCCRVSPPDTHPVLQGVPTLQFCIAIVLDSDIWILKLFGIWDFGFRI